MTDLPKTLLHATPEEAAAIRRRIKEFQGLGTRRLSLRPLTFDDVAQLTALLSDPRITNWVYIYEHPFTTASAYKWINEGLEMQEKGKGMHLGAWYAGSDLLIGEIGLHGAPDHLAAMFGGSLSPPFWGKGFAEEAVGAFLAACFEDFGLRLMHATAALDNRSSHRVIKAMNFLPMGEKTVTTREGVPRPSAYFEMPYAHWREIEDRRRMNEAPGIAV